MAIQALAYEDLPALLLDDLDRARGRLHVRREGQPDHHVYLDEVTTTLAAAWLRERRTSRLMRARNSASLRAGLEIPDGIAVDPPTREVRELARWGL